MCKLLFWGVISSLIISDGTTAIRALTSSQHTQVFIIQDEIYVQLIDNGTIAVNTILHVKNSKTVKAA